MRSPFVRKGKRSFANGLNTNEERSVWIGGTTLVVGQGRRNDSSQDKFPWQSSNGSETSSTNQSSSTSRGLFSLSTGYNNNNDNAAQNHRRQQQNKSRWMERIKALSPRKEKDSRKEKDADEDDDDDVFFFSPDSNPPEGASKSRLPENHEKMKRRLSVSIGGETIIGADVSLSTSSLSSNHYRTRRTNGRNNARRRKRRNSSSNNSYYPLFGSITSVDIPSRALTLSSLDDATEENRDGESARAGEQEVVDDLEAASNISRNGEDDFCEEEEEDDDCYDSFSYQTTPSRVGSKRKIKSVGQQKRVSTTEGRQSSLCDDRHQRESGVKRRRLSKRARTRLTMREVNTHIQPGRHYSALDSMGSLERRKAITLPKTIDFFRRIEIKLIAVNTLVSVALTIIVLHLFPDSWKTSLEETSPAVSLLGAFLSFTLVFRTQTCYHRWWEARTQWGRMTSVCVNLAGQANAWFVDDELIDRFLTHCIVFPYACKAVLRCNELNSSSEEGPRFLQSGMLTDADLGVIIRHGRAPFTCLEILRKTMHEALLQSSHSNSNYNQRRLLPETLNGAYIAMEESFLELYLNFGACNKINSTRMPASYTVFMRSFVIFFFVLASLSWAPTIKWLTPIITGFMVFLINTVIVIGDQMMRPFTLTWSGLPMQKFCVIIEHEILNVSRRRADIDRLK